MFRLIASLESLGNLERLDRDDEHLTFLKRYVQNVDFQDSVFERGNISK